MSHWRNSFEKTLSSTFNIDRAINEYNENISDAEEFGYADDAEFQTALAWFHNAVCEKFSISREKFSLLRVGGQGWDHPSGARLCIFSDSEEIYFVGNCIHYEAGNHIDNGGIGKGAEKNIDVEWDFNIDDSAEINIPEKVFSCEKTIFKNGSFHECFWFGGFIVPAWLAQIIVESNPEGE